MIEGYNYSTLRWIAKTLQAVLIIGTPFVTINGNSLLRFDIPELKLYVFGKDLWMDEFFIVLLGSLFIAFVFILVTLLFGRVWCGWACPQTVLNDITELFFGKSHKRPAYKALFAYFLTFILSALVGANLVWYFVSPYEFFDRLATGSLGEIITGFWLVLSLLMFLNLTLVKRRFCASACPYSKLQSIMFDNHTLVIAFDNSRAKECMNCKACVRACPVGVDLREGLNPACISCAECIDICKRLTAKVNKRTLIDYRFGHLGGPFKPLRPQVIVFGAIVIISLTALVYASAIRNPIDVVITQNQSFQPRLSIDGSMVNSYILTLSNRTNREVILNLKADSKVVDRLLASPQTISVPAKAHLRVPIYVNVYDDTKDNYIDLIINSSEGTTYKKAVGFIRPERR